MKSRKELEEIRNRAIDVYKRQHQPCVICAKMIVNSGIRRVIYGEGYPDDFSLEFFKVSGVELIRYHG